MENTPLMDINKLLEDITRIDGYRTPIAWGIARIDYGQKNVDRVINATFSNVNYKENNNLFAILHHILNGVYDKAEVSIKIEKHMLLLISNIFEEYKDAFASKDLDLLNFIYNTTIEDGRSLCDLLNYHLVAIFEDTDIELLEVAYLKLINNVHYKELNISNIDKVMPILAWSGTFPIELDYLREHEMNLKMTGEFPKIDYIDRYPNYTQCVIPKNNIIVEQDAKIYDPLYSTNRVKGRNIMC